MITKYLYIYLEQYLRDYLQYTLCVSSVKFYDFAALVRISKVITKLIRKRTKLKTIVAIELKMSPMDKWEIFLCPRSHYQL